MAGDHRPCREGVFENRLALAHGFLREAGDDGRCRIGNSAAAESTEAAQKSAARVAAAPGDALENAECFADAGSAAAGAREETRRIDSAATTAAAFTAATTQAETSRGNAREDRLTGRIGEACRDVGAARLCDARSALNQAGSSVDDRFGGIDDGDDVGGAGIDNPCVDDARVGDVDEVVIEWAATSASSENGREKKGDENQEDGALHGAKTYYGSIANGRRSPHSFEPR